jgi:hypothetical protein
LSGPAHAHDIPDEIVLHSFVKPEGDRLHVLVRIPSTMLLNLNMPKWGPGYLDLARMGTSWRKQSKRSPATSSSLRTPRNCIPKAPRRASPSPRTPLSTPSRARAI